MARRRRARRDAVTGPKVLVVENDPVIGELVRAVLTDEGYAVEVVGRVDADALRVAVGRTEPDCVLLDGADGRGYGSSWGEAAWLSGRSRHVPVVMLTTHPGAVAEALGQDTARSQDAAFAAVLAKPFHLDDLLRDVAEAVGASVPFDVSTAGETARTAALVRELRAAGARDV